MPVFTSVTTFIGLTDFSFVKCSAYLTFCFLDRVISKICCSERCCENVSFYFTLLRVHALKDENVSQNYMYFVILRNKN